jgi:hypothetical protein
MVERLTQMLKRSISDEEIQKLIVKFNGQQRWMAYIKAVRSAV